MIDRVLSLVLAAGLAAAPLPLSAQSSGARQAQRGDAVTGVLLSEGGNVLQLDITPCAANRTVVVFRYPYTKEAAGTIHCGSAAKGVVQAIQQ